MTSSSAPR
uniref:Uncharacterized protein n=1 Tax=Arundo donax TaxID=35708 RepID=A0A0A9D6U5_ARUDO